MFYPFGIFNFRGYMSTICNIFFKRSASLLADKKDVSYSVVHDVLAPLSCQFFPAIDCL